MYNGGFMFVLAVEALQYWCSRDTSLLSPICQLQRVRLLHMWHVTETVNIDAAAVTYWHVTLVENDKLNLSCVNQSKANWELVFQRLVWLTHTSVTQTMRCSVTVPDIVSQQRHDHLGWIIVWETMSPICLWEILPILVCVASSFAKIVTWH